MKIKKSKIKDCDENCDFLYDLTDGGYIDPMELLEDKKDAERVVEAAKVIQEFQDVYFRACEEAPE